MYWLHIKWTPSTGTLQTTKAGELKSKIPQTDWDRLSTFRNHGGLFLYPLPIQIWRQAPRRFLHTRRNKRSRCIRSKQIYHCHSGDRVTWTCLGRYRFLPWIVLYSGQHLRSLQIMGCVWPSILPYRHLLPVYGRSHGRSGGIIPKLLYTYRWWWMS